MFELIMLLGFFYAATSRFLPHGDGAPKSGTVDKKISAGRKAGGKKQRGPEQGDSGFNLRWNQDASIAACASAPYHHRC